MKYILTPKDSIVEQAGDPNMVIEGGAIYNVLTNKWKFPGLVEKIEKYSFSVKEKRIELELKDGMDKKLAEYLSQYWDIEKK